MKLLTAAGADVHARSRSYPQTVVGVQTQRTGREELNYVVQRGGSTALLFTARTGDAESARALLEAGANPNDALADGTSALVLSAHSGRTAVGRVLIEKGAEPNAAASGYTALHAAILKSDLALVQALVSHRADPNLPITKGTPIRRETTDFNLPATLIGTSAYQLAARFLEPDIVRVLGASGANLKATTSNGTTVLMLAVGTGVGRNSDRRGISTINFGKVEPESRVLETVKAVLDVDPEANGANQAGDTALHTAAQLGFDTVVQYLVDRGALVNVKNKQGRTPLAVATQRGRGGRGGRDQDGDAPREAPAPSTTAALLRKLGATE